MKYIKIFEMKPDELALDGHTQPGGNLHIKEYEDDEWTGGCYATYENLVEKVKECWEKEPKKNIPDNEEYYYDEVGCELRIKGRIKIKEKPKIVPWDDFNYINMGSNKSGYSGVNS